MNSESRKWNDSKGATSAQVAQNELRREAKERLKLPSFWVGKPREGFTRECQELVQLMKAGPCGTIPVGNGIDAGITISGQRWSKGRAFVDRFAYYERGESPKAVWSD